MACTCKNEDGTLSKNCRGTCKEDLMIEAEMQQRDPHNGLMELIMAQIEKTIQSRMSELRVEFQREQFTLYKKAFIEGIKEGIELSECFSERY